MNKKRILGSMLIATLFLLLIMEPVLAEDVYDTEYQFNYYRIPWGNGIDDDHDGVIDNWGEPDVGYGNITVNETENTIDTWNSSISTDNGVWIGGYYEAMIEVQSAYNASISPVQTCYFANVTDPVTVKDYETITNTISANMFYVNISSTQLMTGCQEFWYRSPLVWDDTIYETYYLNIYDSSGNLVYASNSDEYGTMKQSFLLPDNSTAGTPYERIYLFICMPFRTQEKYTFKEYVSTIGDVAINSVKLFIGQQQDIGDDGLQDTYIFHNTGSQRKIPFESSFSMVCQVGIGRAGTELPLFGPSSDPSGDIIIYSQIIPGSALTNVSSIVFVVPMKFTKKVTFGGMLSVRPKGFTFWASNYMLVGEPNVTGTVRGAINISDPNSATENEYQFRFNIGGLTSSNDAASFYMADESGALILVTGNRLYYEQHSPSSDLGEVLINNFALHIEIYESDTPLASPVSSDSMVEFLKGTQFFLFGIILGIGAVLAGWTPIGLFLGATAIAVTLHGLNMMVKATTGKDLQDFVGGLGGGIIRAMEAYVQGMAWLGQGIIDVVVGVWEAIKWLGNAALAYGGAILSAFVDIIYFLTAVFVWWLMAKFLSIASSIRDGNVEGAASTIISIEKGFRKRARTIYRDTKTGKKILFGKKKEEPRTTNIRVRTTFPREEIRRRAQARRSNR